MIEINIGPRLGRKLGKLDPEIRAKIAEQLRLLAECFGDPHQHSGLGLRKLGRRSFEIRVALQWRIVVIHRPNDLIAYDLMDHDEVIRWAKLRKGD